MVDKRGEARSLLNHRSRIVRELDHWLSRIAPAMERQAASEQDLSPPQRSDYIRALRRIGLGYDTTASARDRLQALEKLVEIDSQPGPISTVVFQVPTSWPVSSAIGAGRMSAVRQTGSGRTPALSTPLPVRWPPDLSASVDKESIQATVPRGRKGP